MNSHLLQLKLFGTPQISYLGQPLSGFVSGKVRALLIYLAVTARPQSRDHLAEFFWADTPASSRVNLRKALSNLRGLLGDVLREDGKESILLDPQQVWVDVIEFAQLVKQEREPEAIQLYHADFLSGFNFSLSYEFETWALSEQSRLKTQYVDLLRRLATQQDANHKLGEAISTVRHLLQLEPWHEEAHRWLMELLARDGQRSAALAHFEVAKRVLREELDVAPNEETLNLLARIQRSVDAPAKPRPRTSSIPKPEFPLIGRQQELQTIQSAWEKCLQAGPHFVCIAGEAGIGKTRLTEEVRLWVAQQGYATAYARSYAAEGSLAYSPVVDWLRSEAIRSSLEQLEPVWLNEIVRLLPELLKGNPHLAHPKPISDGLQRRYFFEALARAIFAGDQPLLLVIDDLQWCDRETLEWLRFLLRFEPNYPLLLIGAYRVEEVDAAHPLQTLLFDLRRDDLVTEFELGMLSAAETEQLIHTIAAHDLATVQSNELWRTTDGHPLFVVESMRSKSEEQKNGTLPRKVQNVIQSRLTQLSQEAREVVEMAAVTGRSFSIQLLALASQQDEHRLVRQLDELWQRRIIVERVVAQFDFSHDRIREVVYANIRPLLRQRLHQQIAEALAILYQADLSEWHGQIAVHYQLAGKLNNALPYFVQAAQISVNRWILGEALALIEQALTSQQPLAENETNLRNLLALRTLQYEVLTRLKGYMEPQLREVIAQISQLSEALQDVKGLFLAGTKLRLYHSLRAEWVQAKPIAEKNIQIAQQTSDQDMVSEAYLVLGRINFYMGDLTLAKARYDQGNQILDTIHPEILRFDKGQPPHVNAFNNTAHCYYVLGHLAQAQAWTDRAIQIAETSNHHHALVEATHFNLIFRFIARQPGSEEKANRMLETAQKHNLAFYAEMGKLHLGWAWVGQNRFEEGIHQLQQTIDHFERAQLGMFHVKRLGMLIESYRMAQCYAEGIATVQRAFAFAERTSDRFWIPELYRLWGELLLGSQAASDAVEDCYQKSLTVSSQQGSRLLELRTSVSLARLWQAQGKHTEAYQLLAPIYGWFTEGFDTVDLVKARLLLDELTIDQS